jgi:hypothetical protein
MSRRAAKGRQGKSRKLQEFCRREGNFIFYN